MAILKGDEITVTQAARDYLVDLAAARDVPATALRLSVREGKGCGGHEYDLHFADAANAEEDDIMPVSDTLSLCIPKKDMLRLFGMKIDYITDNLGNSRLDLSNPNEKGRCGCGESVVF